MTSKEAIVLEPSAVIADKLRLIRPLGQGGMGVVWAARHLSLETDVAVKLIRPERARETPALIARFEREAKTTARIVHPNVVKVMDYGTIGGVVPYLVMELLQGFTLAELLEKGGRLSLSTARSLVMQIGRALASAHERGVVHRDIKPHNIFITEGSQGYPLFVKVLDFGVAKMVEGAEVPGASAALTEAGVIIGSAPYMSPEQLEGRKDIDLRSDLWSLSIIAYECLTGRLPFRGSSLVTVGAAVLKGKYTPATELRPNLPASIDHFFAKALCVDPDGRFQSAGELVEAFPDQEFGIDESALSGQFVGTDGETVEHKVHPKRPGEASFSEEGGTDVSSPAQRHPDADALATTEMAPVPPLRVEAPPSDISITADHAVSAPKETPSPNRRRPSWRVTIPLVLVGAGACVAAYIAIDRSTSGRGCPPGMVLIEGTTFRMGSPAEGETPTDETPDHDVTVGSFCLDVTEVSVKEYSACTACGPRAMTVEIEGLTSNARKFWSPFCNGDETPDHPVNCVDWNQANAYCASVNKRLPTEVEWELAARGKERRTYPWGAAPPSGERLNACGAECSRMLTAELEKVGKGAWPGMYVDDDSAPSTAPVGQFGKGASPLGVLDLAGNVWEWTESHYCPYTKGDCGDSRRVLRGGGWDTVDSQFVRSAHRRPSAPSARGWSIGFRCAKSP